MYLQDHSLLASDQFLKLAIAVTSNSVPLTTKVSFINIRYFWSQAMKSKLTKLRLAYQWTMQKSSEKIKSCLLIFVYMFIFVLLLYVPLQGLNNYINIIIIIVVVYHFL